MPNGHDGNAQPAIDIAEHNHAVEAKRVAVVDSSGNQITSFGSSSVAVTDVVPGTAATNLGKAEDASHTSGDTGVMALGVRNDSGDVKSTTDGDYEPIPVGSHGSLAGVHTHIVGDGDKYVRGILDHDAPDTGIEPVVMGTQAKSSAPTAVTNGDIVRLYADTQGRLFVTADKTGTFQTVETAPTGTRTDGSVTLTSATTAYQVPQSGSVPSSAYLLVISSNVANTTEMRWRFNTGTTLGHPIGIGGSVTIRLPASAALYLYSTAAGQIANWSAAVI